MYKTLHAQSIGKASFSTKCLFAETILSYQAWSFIWIWSNNSFLFTREANRLKTGQLLWRSRNKQLNYFSLRGSQRVIFKLVQVFLWELAVLLENFFMQSVHLRGAAAIYKS